EEIVDNKLFTLSKKDSSFTWKKMAAAAVVFLLLGTGLFYFLKDNNSNKLIAVEKTPAPEDIAPPNTVNATLTLSNGVTIVLDSAGNGMLAKQGDVNVMKLSEGQIAYDPVLSNTHAGEIKYNTLSNPRGSKMVNILLADGTKVWLNAESSLRYPTVFVGKDRQVEITGEAYFEVAHNAAMPFHVSVDGMIVEVLGTHFNINSFKEENALRTTLLEGSVKVNMGSKNRILKPGEQAQVSRTGKHFISISKPDVQEVMAWKEGRFLFSNMDLESIMRQLSRWYNVDVVYETDVSDRYTLNVSRDVPVSQLFKFIEISGGVKFDIRNNRITVKK
ncbi:MAG: FecR domain-containing protein, partial [Ginsengibacter sp.]